VFPLLCEEVSTTDPPVQNVVGPPADMVGADGIAFTVTTTGDEDGDSQPLPFVCITL
jgi:hypothetical protein